MSGVTPDAMKSANHRLRVGVLLRAPNSLPYRNLAYTCTRCGGLLTRKADQLRRDSGRSHVVMHECDLARIRRWRSQMAPEVRQAHDSRNRNLPARRELIEQVRARATNYGKQWTGPELEIALRSDLTTQQAAELLSRSIQAVQTVRWRATHEPKLARVLGAQA